MRASASSPPRPNTNGSPPFRRTTAARCGPGRRARLICSWVRSTCREPCPPRSARRPRGRLRGVRAKPGGRTPRRRRGVSSAEPCKVSSPGSPGPAPPGRRSRGASLEQSSRPRAVERPPRSTCSAAAARPATTGRRHARSHAARRGRRPMRAAPRSRSRRRRPSRSAPHGQVAAPAELGEERPFGEDLGVRAESSIRRAVARRVVVARGTRPRGRPARPAGASPTDRGTRRRGRQAEPLERGRGHDDRIEICGACSRRVGMLPRSSANVRSGRSAASWARRRTEPVPMRAPRQRVEGPAHERVARVGPLGERGEHETVGDADAGRSLAECTARSARPSSTACCTSFTNMPVPPIAWIGDVGALVTGGRRRSPTRYRSPSSVTTRSSLPPCERAAARRDAQRARHQRSGSATSSPKRSTRASAYWSPRAVPAASFTRTVGSCSNLFTMLRVSCSTASRSAGSSASSLAR